MRNGLRQRRVGRSVLVAFALVVATVIAGDARAHASTPWRSSAQVYLYADFGNPVNSSFTKNPLVVRPPTLFLTEDGTVAVNKLSWSGWGSSAAHAHGIFSASNCRPNCAQGKRTADPAQVTLSSPGVVFGHTVYRCLHLAVPKLPRPTQMCLGPLPGNGSPYGYVIGATKAVPPKSAGAPTTLEFRTTLPGGVGCEMDARGPTLTQVFCQSVPPTDPTNGHTATLKANGPFTTCGATCVGNAGEGTPTFPVGKTATVGPFTCTVESGGVQCVVTATGKGFLFNQSGATAVP